MSFISKRWLMSGVSLEVLMSRSAYFDGANDRLEFTPLSAGNLIAWTFRTRVRRDKLGTNQHLLSVYLNNSNYFDFRFGTNDQLYVQNRVGGSNLVATYFGTAVYRDTGAFYDICLQFDNGVFTLYVNGELHGTLGTASQACMVQTANRHAVGASLTGSGGSVWGWFDGKLNETYLINSIVDPADFVGEYTGVYGSHDFYQDYSNAFRLGDDIAHIDANGYASLNPNAQCNSYKCSFSNGGKTITAQNDTWVISSVLSDMAFDVEDAEGWYVRFYLDYCTWSGQIYYGVSEETYYGTPPNNTKTHTAAFGAADNNSYISMFAKNGNVWVAKNGVWAGDPVAGTGATWTGLTGDHHFMFGCGSNGGGSNGILTADFSDATDMPVGGKLLCTDNLPEPSTYNTSDFFEVLTYKGNGGTQKIKGADWEGDDSLVWLKNRDAGSHTLFDSIRGVNLRLVTDTTAAQAGASGVSAFHDDGFTVGSSNWGNPLNDDVVAWRFRLGSNQVANNTGSIQSTVSGNDHFAVVTANLSGSGSATIGHGNGKKPCYIVGKSLTNNTGWLVYHEAQGAGKYGRLDTTAAFTTNNLTWGGIEPDGDVFTLGEVSGHWGTGEHIFIIFYESDLVKPFSYTGNGVTDGPFVNTDGEPLWFFRKRTDTTTNWTVFDKVRDQDGSIGKALIFDSSGAESDAGSLEQYTFEDTGIKVKGTGSGANGGTQIGIAIIDQQPQVTLSGNDFDNIGAAEQTQDNPKDTFCTLQPLDYYAGTLTKGNTSVITNGPTNSGTRGTIYASKGKFSWQQRCVTDNHAASIYAIGVISLDDDDQFYSYSYYGYDGAITPPNGAGAVAYGSAFGDGAYIETMLDVDNNRVQYVLNGMPQGWYTLPVGKSWTIHLNDGGGTGNTATFDVDFAQETYTPYDPDFLPLSSANLPDFNEGDVSNVFLQGTYVGTGAAQTINFKDDEGNLIDWGPNAQYKLHIKCTTLGGYYHTDWDTMRGPLKRLSTNVADAETNASGVTALNSNSFEVGTSGFENEVGETFVYWVERAGEGTPETDNTGSITSTVSAGKNLSIVTVVGANPSSVIGTRGTKGSRVPAMIIGKRLTAGSNWIVWHKDLHTTSANTTAMYLNLVSVNATNTLNIAACDGSTLTLGSSVEFYNAWVFCIYYDEPDTHHTVFKYKNTNSADGPLLYMGGPIASALLKTSNTSCSWYLYNTVLSTSNPMSDYIVLDTPAGKGTSGHDVDGISNGAKLKMAGADPNYLTGDSVGSAWLKNRISPQHPPVAR
jgi:hypothetical protein